MNGILIGFNPIQSPFNPHESTPNITQQKTYRNSSFFVLIHVNPFFSCHQKFPKNPMVFFISCCSPCFCRPGTLQGPAALAAPGTCSALPRARWTRPESIRRNGGFHGGLIYHFYPFLLVFMMDFMVLFMVVFMVDFMVVCLLVVFMVV